MRVSSHQCNSTPSHFKSCMYFSDSSMVQTKGNTFSGSIDGENFNYGDGWDQVTTPFEADASSTRLQKDHSKGYEDDTIFDAMSSGPLKEMNSKKIFGDGSSFKHVPHRQKAPQLVAKRNLRERNRVQAVNTAFNRLRKAVPIQHARGKRISKVKTLQNAINYIKGLEKLLDNEYFQPVPFMEYYGTLQDTILWGLDY